MRQRTLTSSPKKNKRLSNRSAIVLLPDKKTAFCGDLVDYSGEAIVEAIHDVLELDEEVLVVPVLLGVDEMLQTNTIEAAVNAVPTSSRIRYEPTSVLPDSKVNEWIVKQVQAAVDRAHDAGGDIVGEVMVPSEL